MTPIWTLLSPAALPSQLQWELLEHPVLPILADPPSPSVLPLAAEDIDAALESLPFERSNYYSLLRLSPAVPTTNTLPENQWSAKFGVISPFDAGATGGFSNQNYFAYLDVGLSDNLLLSAFASQADDLLSVVIKGLEKPSVNFWQSYGTSLRWRWLKREGWAAALNGSMEMWEVTSGGAFAVSSLESGSSPNIFNNSGERVFTRNLVGSFNTVLSWEPSSALQFNFSTGLSFLPAKQGASQGGAGEFYGTNIFISGGILFQPIPELDFTVSVAQPIGSGTNTFDENLIFSSVPILSAGVNWDLNPRIGFSALLTNGFGATPATALLTPPSVNRLGYSVKLLFTPDAPDTPQVPLSQRQRSIAQGGFTVNTALVPPDDEIDLGIDFDSKENSSVLLGYSLSNIFQFQLGSTFHNTTFRSPLQTSDCFSSWWLGGKVILLSPLRGAPFWVAGRLTAGPNNHLFLDACQDDGGLGNAFVEAMATLETSPNLSLSFNPKLAISSVGQLWGLGLSLNYQILSTWQLIVEGNVAMNNLNHSRSLYVGRNIFSDDLFQTNGTIGFRWQVNNGIAVDVYGTTSASLSAAGQLLSSNQVRWGTRLMVSF